jgi:hypothetical protein
MIHCTEQEVFQKTAYENANTMKYFSKQYGTLPSNLPDGPGIFTNRKLQHGLGRRMEPYIEAHYP